jgi:hypothetical protein
MQGEAARRIAGTEIRERIARNRTKRLAIAEAMKLEAGVRGHKINTEDFSGLAYLGTGQIYSPEGRNMVQLYTLAHECGHIFLHDKEPGSRLPSHVMEMEAESYAHQAFREHGMALPRNFTDWGRRYVASWIEKDRAKGIVIDPRALAYASGERSPFAPLRRVPPTWRRHAAAGSLMPGPVRLARAHLARAMQPLIGRERRLLEEARALAVLSLRQLIFGGCLSIGALQLASGWLGLERLVKTNAYQLSWEGGLIVLCGALLWTDLVLALRVALGPLTRPQPLHEPKPETALSSG